MTRARAIAKIFFISLNPFQKFMFASEPGNEPWNAPRENGAKFRRGQGFLKGRGRCGWTFFLSRGGKKRAILGGNGGFVPKLEQECACAGLLEGLRGRRLPFIYGAHGAQRPLGGRCGGANCYKCYGVVIISGGFLAHFAKKSCQTPF